MAIKYAILGFLSWQALSGYDLKKLFEQAYFLYWSGNNNQIYTTLVQLHKDGAVTTEIDHQESGPSRKIYTITDEGRQQLREWLLAGPELPQLRQPFFLQLMWADTLSPVELDELCAAYEHKMAIQLLMCQEKARRNELDPARSDRERLLWQLIAERWIGFYTEEVAWVQRLRAELAGKE